MIPRTRYFGVFLHGTLKNLVQCSCQKKISGSYNIAVHTVALFRYLISKAEWKTAQELIDYVKLHGKTLAEALPLEVLTVNMARCVLKIIREEYDAVHKLAQKVRREMHKPHFINSLRKLAKVQMLKTIQSHRRASRRLRDAILKHLQALESELETSADVTSSQAEWHIRSFDIILTLGYSATVEQFLKKAAQKLQFEVVIAEFSPHNKGHILAASLARSKIPTTVISDAAIYAMMSRVDSVIIGAHCVLANGGLRGVRGSLIVALAAEHHSVPVLVVTPMYKLTPLYLCSLDQDTFNLLESPEGALPYNSGAVTRLVKVYNSVFDYVPPELVTSIISFWGCDTPENIYRFLRDLYHPHDYDL